MRVPWLQLLRHRQTWAFLMAKFMTDPIWWFFLFWLPKFLNAEYGLTLIGLGAAAGRDLSHGGRRQHRGRLDCGAIHQARLEREPCAQSRDADLRTRRHADHASHRTPTICGSPSR